MRDQVRAFPDAMADPADVTINRSGCGAALSHRSVTFSSFAREIQLGHQTIEPTLNRQVNVRRPNVAFCRRIADQV